MEQDWRSDPELLGGSWESEIRAARSVGVMTETLAFSCSGLNCSRDGCLGLLTQTYSSHEQTFFFSPEFLFFLLVFYWFYLLISGSLFLLFVCISLIQNTLRNFYCLCIKTNLFRRWKFWGFFLVLLK